MDRGENSIRNVLSVDVEEWYQTVLFDERGYDDRRITNLPANVQEILSILDEYKAKATFFMVGAVAEKYPDIVNMIVQQGHELASHGYLHKLIPKMSKEAFAEDVRRSLETIKIIAKTEVYGYRAPTWSLTSSSCWAIDILKSLGLKYDSSIYPFDMNLFRCRNLEKFPYEIRQGFMEFPPSTFQCLGYNLPFAGGTFLRVFPSGFISARIREINRKGYPAMVYIHPWEFDREISKLVMPGWKYFIQYSNAKSIRKKLRFLLKRFKFSSIKDVLLNQEGEPG